MNRRQFIKTTGVSLAATLVYRHALAAGTGMSMAFPDRMSALVDDRPVTLTGSGRQWQYRDITVRLTNTGSGMTIDVQAPKVRLSAITMQWSVPTTANTTILNDHWERTYGDVSWHKPIGDAHLPWYFMEMAGNITNGFGVKTGAGAFASWQVGPKQLSLTLDTRTGGMGTRLGDRTLRAAELVTMMGKAGERPFLATRRFMSVMCPKARMPKQPVYGINDWYFSYGNNSAKLILAHTNLLTAPAAGLSNRPFSVIDAGWFAKSPASPDDCCWGDNMHTPNEKFGDMARVAEQINQMGMRPAIWTRPLCASYADPKTVLLPTIAGRNDPKHPVLDPTIPENVERIKAYFTLYPQWGYEMVKFDFTTYDMLGKWGFEMNPLMTQPNWTMHDDTRTNAEIILDLYKTIRQASGDTYLIGCNTISHLSAGQFELNRIGDDTSGNEWDRTRKMGVNTLAFRGVQHGTFYAADADCVGLTNKVPWSKNQQWMQLLAESGTPLFISAQPDATGAAQKAFIKDCFRAASQPQPLGEPLDWLQSPLPKTWKLDGKQVSFNWD